jgi:hypothetical protein
MHRIIPQSTKFRAERKAMGFTMNKLQTVACLAASVAVSIGIIVWGN